MGRLEKNCKWHLVKIMIISNFCSIMLFNVCRFRDKRGQRFAVLAPEIPHYVTDDLKFYMKRLR